jgi:hypothetical protein
MLLGTFPALKKMEKFPTLRKSLTVSDFSNITHKKAIPPR